MEVHFIKDHVKDGNVDTPTTTFVMLDPRNLEFIGSIPDVMLKKVPLDNAIIRSYRKFPSSGVRPIPAELKKVVDEGDKTK